LKENSKKELYAILSSSLKEDLQEASFAGEYETKLCITFLEI